MYLAHWGLRRTPFGSRPDPRHFHSGPTHEEALARIHFLADQRRRLGLLLGGPGSGKSLVLEVAAEQLRQEGRAVARVGLLGIDADEFLWHVALELGVNPESKRATSHLWRAVSDRIVENRYQLLETVILLDDADGASEEVLTSVVRLSQCDPSPDARLTVVAAVQASAARRIGSRLLELVDLRIDLEPWDEVDTIEYVTWALHQVGARQNLFDDDALLRLHDLSRGVPRRVNQLADLALLAGAGQRLERIDVETVESVHQELSIRAPAAL